MYLILPISINLYGELIVRTRERDGAIIEVKLWRN